MPHEPKIKNVQHAVWHRNTCTHMGTRVLSSTSRTGQSYSRAIGDAMHVAKWMVMCTHRRVVKSYLFIDGLLAVLELTVIPEKFERLQGIGAAGHVGIHSVVVDVRVDTLIHSLP